MIIGGCTLALKKIVTPDFGGTADVTVIEILVKPGDTIQKEASIVTLESEKATMELPSTETGVVKEIKVKVGDKVKEGDVIITLEAEEDKTAKREQAKEKKEEKESKPQQPEKPIQAEQRIQQQPEAPLKPQPEASQQTEVLEGTIESDGDIHAGPGVRRMARELGVNLNLVRGSGPKERILKEDIQSFVKGQLTQTQTVGMPSLAGALPAIDFSKFGPTEVKALSRIKKLSGKYLQRNWMMIPHVTQFAEADITALEDFRKSQKAELEKQQVRLTPLVFVMKAAVASLKVFPSFNASLDVNGENLIIKKYFHIGVAVDTPDGLVVPVIRDVDKKGLVELAKELGTVSEKARKKQLIPADMQGGCFSISSLGGIGGTAFTPIINHPEVAILGVSKAAYKPVFQDETFIPRLMLPLSLSYDHRVIDGAEGARFIVHLTHMLSDIRNLLL